MQQTQKHRKLNRLKNYNYSWGGYYYITICTQNKQHFFGEVKNSEMILNEFGNLVKKYWLEIPKHFSCCKLDHFIIMSNHIHGILIIENNVVVGTEYVEMEQVETEQCSVSTGKMQLLSQIVKSFKEICTKTIRREFKNYQFQWQRSFYDHIIRNEIALNNIQQYILNNPKNWNKDEENDFYDKK